MTNNLDVTMKINDLLIFHESINAERGRGNNQPSVSGNVPNHAWKHKVNTLIILIMQVAVNLSFKSQCTRISLGDFWGRGC